MNQQYLKELLSYDPDTGIFIWITSNNIKIKIGSIAGGVDSKHHYRRIKIDGKKYLAHRLAWLYVYGEWPKKFIDHKNNIRDDNRIDNLREATRQQNNSNAIKRKDNTSGYKGVHWSKQYKKWLVQCNFNKKKYKGGKFDNLEDAAQAYKELSDKLHGEFARNGHI